MKYIKAIPSFLLWLFYVLITANDRARYTAGVHRGLHCHKMTTHMNSTTYHFLPGTKPYREYITWREFWQQRGFYNN